MPHTASDGVMLHVTGIRSISRYRNQRDPGVPGRSWDLETTSEPTRTLRNTQHTSPDHIGAFQQHFR